MVCPSKVMVTGVAMVAMEVGLLMVCFLHAELVSIIIGGVASRFGCEVKGDIDVVVPSVVVPKVPW